MNQFFHFIVSVSNNVGNYIKTIKNQSYTNYDVCVLMKKNQPVIDFPDIVKKQSSGIKLLDIRDCIKDFQIAPNDVLVLVDDDTWIWTSGDVQILQRIKRVYDSKDVWVATGVTVAVQDSSLCCMCKKSFQKYILKSINSYLALTESLDLSNFARVVKQFKDHTDCLQILFTKNGSKPGVLMLQWPTESVLLNKALSKISDKPSWVFKVIIPHFETPQFLDKGLESLKNQTYPYFDVIVTDDASSPFVVDQLKELELNYKNSFNVTILYEEQNMGSIYNVLKGIKAAKPNDEDVLVFLDGDDWLNGNDALDMVKKAYSDPLHETWLTYGQFVRKGKKCCGCPDQSKNIKDNSWRTAHFAYTHLKTAKYHLFKRIQDEDFKIDGRFLDGAWDRVVMYPMLEMAGPRSQCIKKAIYAYNMNNQYSWFKDRKHFDMMSADANIIKKKESYLPLKDKWDVTHKVTDPLPANEQ